jgi:hypothetical protein
MLPAVRTAPTKINAWVSQGLVLCRVFWLREPPSRYPLHDGSPSTQAIAGETYRTRTIAASIAHPVLCPHAGGGADFGARMYPLCRLDLNGR